jgi:hypothetical protein
VRKCIGTTSLGLERAHDRRGRLAADRRPVTGRQEQYVDRADRLHLLRPQRRLPEVAEVAEAEAADREAHDQVRAAGRPGDVVVLRSNRDDLADRRLVGPGRADHDGVAADRLDAVVVEMLVRDEQQVGAHVFDRRVAELDSAAGHRAHVAEGVDEHRLLAFDQEGGLPVPADQRAHEYSGMSATKDSASRRSTGAASPFRSCCGISTASSTRPASTSRA